METNLLWVMWWIGAIAVAAAVVLPLLGVILDNWGWWRAGIMHRRYLRRER